MAETKLLLLWGTQMAEDQRIDKAVPIAKTTATRPSNRIMEGSYLSAVALSNAQNLPTWPIAYHLGVGGCGAVVDEEIANPRGSIGNKEE